MQCFNQLSTSDRRNDAECLTLIDFADFSPDESSQAGQGDGWFLSYKTTNRELSETNEKIVKYLSHSTPQEYNIYMMRGKAAERKGMIRERRTDKHGPESRDERGETTEEETSGEKEEGDRWIKEKENLHETRGGGEDEGEDADR